VKKNKKLFNISEAVVRSLVASELEHALRDEELDATHLTSYRPTPVDL
jgi:hypothetical protein